MVQVLRDETKDNIDGLSLKLQENADSNLAILRERMTSIEEAASRSNKIARIAEARITDAVSQKTQENIKACEYIDLSQLIKDPAEAYDDEAKLLHAGKDGAITIKKPNKKLKSFRGFAKAIREMELEKP